MNSNFCTGTRHHDWRGCRQHCKDSSFTLHLWKTKPVVTQDGIATLCERDAYYWTSIGSNAFTYLVVTSTYIHIDWVLSKHCIRRHLCFWLLWDNFAESRGLSHFAQEQTIFYLYKDHLLCVCVRLCVLCVVVGASLWVFFAACMCVSVWAEAEWVGQKCDRSAANRPGIQRVESFVSA